MPQSSFDHRKPKSWQKVTITVPDQHSDIVASFLAELTNSAIEQSAVSAPLPAAPTDQVTVYLEENEDTETLNEQIMAFLSALETQHNFSYTLASEQIIEEDWNKNWKKHFKPFKLTKRLVVKPSWEDYSAEHDEVVLEMDPGMAFGTGLHASTRLALQLIEDLFSRKAINSVLDVGTGTGILGMSCALFGGQKVVGIDNDIDARVAAIDNIQKNHLEEKMSIIDEDLSQILSTFDLVIANITQDVLTLLAKSLIARLNPGGSLILSGILTGEQSEGIQHTFTSAGLKTFATKQSEEWTALHFTAPQ
jgi:ribosomal protein L11 methyltransferase